MFAETSFPFHNVATVDQPRRTTGLDIDNSKRPKSDKGTPARSMTSALLDKVAYLKYNTLPRIQPKPDVAPFRFPSSFGKTSGRSPSAMVACMGTRRPETPCAYLATGTYLLVS